MSDYPVAQPMMEKVNLDFSLPFTDNQEDPVDALNRAVNFIANHPNLNLKKENKNAKKK